MHHFKFRQQNCTSAPAIDDIERRPRRPGGSSDDDSYHGGARAHPRRNAPLPPRNPAAASLATAPPRAIPQLKTATGGLAQPPARQSGGSAAGGASGSLAGTSPPAPGSYPGSYTGSYTLTDSPATSEAPTPTVRDTPALQHFGPATGMLRPHFGEVPPQFRCHQTADCIQFCVHLTAAPRKPSAEHTRQCYQEVLGRCRLLHRLELATAGAAHRAARCARPACPRQHCVPQQRRQRPRRSAHSLPAPKQVLRCSCDGLACVEELLILQAGGQCSATPAVVHVDMLND